MRTLIILSLFSFILFSCEKNFTTDQLSGDISEVQMIQSIDLNFADAEFSQSSNAASVFRFDGEDIWIVSDFDRGLSAVIGGNAFSRCTTGDWMADLSSFQDVVRDEGDDIPRINRLVKGDDVQVDVWNGVPLLCSTVVEEETVYSGTGDYVSTDNDLSPDGQNRNTWGVRLHGDGITIIYKASWDGEDFDTFSESARILIK